MKCCLIKNLSTCVWSRKRVQRPKLDYEMQIEPKNKKENPKNANKTLKLMQLIQVTLSPPSLNYALSSVHKTIDRKIKGKRNRVLPWGTQSLDACRDTCIWRYITGHSVI